ncbi:MAG: hypothetical protein PHE93_01625 [Clostridia bacterium]|nr:hypothetical protein [Clostridia bacterium]
MDKRKLTNLDKHIIICPHCGKKALDHMTECPSCKEPLETGYHEMSPEKKKQTKKLLWIVLGIVAVIVVVLALTGKI